MYRHFRCCCSSRRVRFVCRRAQRTMCTRTVASTLDDFSVTYPSRCGRRIARWHHFAQTASLTIARTLLLSPTPILTLTPWPYRHLTLTLATSPPLFQNPHPNPRRIRYPTARPTPRASRRPSMQPPRSTLSPPPPPPLTRHPCPPGPPIRRRPQVTGNSTTTPERRGSRWTALTAPASCLASAVVLRLVSGPCFLVGGSWLAWGWLLVVERSVDCCSIREFVERCVNAVGVSRVAHFFRVFGCCVLSECNMHRRITLKGSAEF